MISLFSAQIFSQNYSVTPIPFQQFTGNLTPINVADDMNSPSISLPFNFVFYGGIYNSIVVGTNGYITFNSNLAMQFSPYSFSTTIPNASFPVTNAFLGAYHDMNNASTGGQVAGTIVYGVSGIAPYRKFVVYFNNVPLFNCTNLRSSFQMILHETTNVLDVQLIDKQSCTSWQNGRTVTGIINNSGTNALAAPNRNTGTWTAFHEGWRFSPAPIASNNYSFVKCDDNLDGFETFNLAVVQNDLNANNPTAVSFHNTMSDAVNNVNPQNLLFVNSSQNTQTIYAAIDGATAIYSINLTVLDCAFDYDADTVPTENEDANADTNLANDDTDADGIANFVDNDDDGDLVLTNLEYVFSRNSSLLDSDGDLIPNYLDTDDDNDGVLTLNEDANGNNNPTDDDADGNNVADYLQNNGLGNENFNLQKSISIYPNPATNILNIDNKSNQIINLIAIYSIKGDLIKQENKVNNIAVSDLENGIYFIKIVLSNNVLNYKFIKE